MSDKSCLSNAHKVFMGVLIGSVVVLLIVVIVLVINKPAPCESMGNNKVSTTKSRFSTSASELDPTFNLPRRPVNEQTSSQNQMNSDLSTLKLSTENVDNLDSIEPYDPARLSLEKSVFDSHREFVEDAYISTQGANSTDSVRSDSQDINPRVGLRKIDYTGVFSGETARVVSSESPDQIAQTNGSFVI